MSQYFARMRLCILIPLVAALVGCATVYEGKYSTEEGWRYGWVQAIGAAKEFSDASLGRCTGPGKSDNQRVVKISLRNGRLNKTVALPESKDSSMRAGDKVYVNMRRCEVVLHPAPA